MVEVLEAKVWTFPVGYPVTQRLWSCLSSGRSRVNVFHQESGLTLCSYCV